MKQSQQFLNNAENCAELAERATDEPTYKRSLALKPSPAVYNALGVVQRRLGKMDEAEDQFAKAKALDPVR
jgi:tetratricopeptide (TPR) repeat protein